MQAPVQQSVDPRHWVAAATGAKLGDRARELQDDDLDGRSYLERLMAHQLYADAIRFLAQILPKRQAVWWACMCAWQSCRPSPPTEVLGSFRRALRWVLDPHEAHRQAAKVTEFTKALQTSAGSLPVAVVWSGGSMTDPGLPRVPPPDYLTGRAAAHAILLAAAEREPMKYLHHYRQFLALGLEVAEGKILWTGPEGDSVSGAEAPESVVEELVSVR